MKKKMILLVAIGLLTTSCSMFKKNSVSSLNSEEEGNSLTSVSSVSNSTTSKVSTSEGPTDYTTVSLTMPTNLNKRTIASIDDVTFDDFFNLNNKISISIDMTESELNKLQSDYETYKSNGNAKSEKYRHAKKVTIKLTNNSNTFTWEYEDVGIRQKGNTSRDDILESGEIQSFHIKLAFDETWTDSSVYSSSELCNWTDEELAERESRDFLGMSGLDTKFNKVKDESHVREIYASQFYKAAGIIAQNITLGGISINRIDSSKSVSMGVYTIYEPASKSLIKRALKTGNIVDMPSWSEEKDGTGLTTTSNYGDLYKCSWGHGSGSSDSGASMTSSSYEGDNIGVNSSDGTYVPTYNKKTNKDDGHSALKNALAAINTGTYTTIDNKVDLKYFAITEACNYYIGNPDDLRNNFNNYMIYIRKSDGKMITIPIDNDRAFGSGSADWNPDGTAMSKVAIFDTKARGNNRDQPNKLFTSTILKSGYNEAKNTYLEYIKAFKKSALTSTDYYTQMYNLAYSHYSSIAKVSFSSTGSINMSYQEYMNNKLSYVDLDYSLSGGGTSSTSQTSATSTSKTTTSLSTSKVSYGAEAPYSPVYLQSSVTGWSSTDYPLTYQGDGVYTTEGIGLSSGQEISFKFNDGNGWTNLNWGKVSGTENTLSLKSGENFTYTASSTGYYVITVNLSEMTVTVALE